jgi:hypothetical protein
MAVADLPFSLLNRELTGRFGTLVHPTLCLDEVLAMFEQKLVAARELFRP